MQTKKTARNRGSALIGCIATFLFTVLPSQSRAQGAVSVIDLPAASTRSAYAFASVLNVAEFPNGRVAVNDATSRQLFLLDRSLLNPTVLLDSALTTASYGRNSVSIVACNCRELWFPDVASRSILAFDESGIQKRVMSAPSASDFNLMMSAKAISDTINNLYYRGRPPRGAIPGMPARPGVPVPDPDSSPLLRANFDTRKVDTIAKLKALRSTVQYATADSPTHIAVDILASIDEWAATPDGTVAVVRGHDYHVDWYLPNGQVVASAKLPFDFKKLTNADKASLMDSARKAELEKHRASYDRAKAAGGIQAIGMSSVGGGAAVATGPPMIIPVGEYHVPLIDSVPFERIPDYYPPIRGGAVLADLDGNIWILPTTSAQSRAGELVYDVVNRQHGLVVRVRVPVGRSIIGFGRDGVVYMVAKDGSGKWAVEKTSLPRKVA
ncbi:MAG: hypothetical protein ABJB74_00945 [Gemmatimonas sp.]